ncbi:hypothetical protein KCU84_g13545, partial [Aureobasidium melanogenum]
VHDLERGFANHLAKGGFTIGKDLLRYRIEWRAKCADYIAPPEWKVTHSTDRAIWFWGGGIGQGLTADEKKVLKDLNAVFSRFVNGEDVQWSEQGLKMMCRLNSAGQMDMWEDDRWERGLEGWEAMNGSYAPIPDMYTNNLIQGNDKSTSPASMNDHENTSSMRVKRLAYQSENAPFGLWTRPSPVDDPIFAPCYMPYGESSPPIKSGSATEQITTDQTTTVESVETDVLKPWEKGSKSGKKIKRGPKVRVGRTLASDVVSNNMSSNRSSDSCFENGSSGSSNNKPSTTTTSTQSSSQNLLASHTGRYPVLDVAQHAGRPIAPLLPHPGPYQIIHPDTAQAAIAMSRKRKHDRVENEAPVPSAKMHRRE